MGNICVMFYAGDKRSCTAVFCKNWELHVRRLGVCGYGYDISMDIHEYICGYPRKICGYGWEISYPRQTWLKHESAPKAVASGGLKSGTFL